MRALMPFSEERDFDGVLRRTRETVYSMEYSLEYSRVLLEFVESTLGLFALVFAVHGASSGALPAMTSAKLTSWTEKGRNGDGKPWQRCAGEG